VECPICKGQKSKTFITCKDHTVSQEEFAIVECEECSFRYTNPRPSQAEIGSYYKSEEYISHTNTSKGLVNTIYKQVRKHTLNQKLRLIKRFSSGRKLLDYGSGAGFFLKHCLNNGWTGLGIEADKDTRQKSRNELGIDVLSPDQLVTLERMDFDVISLWHVLEHVHELDSTLSALIGLLKDDGILIVAVPNCSSYDARVYGKYWAAYDVPRHLYHFRPENMKKLAAKFELELLEIKPMVFDAYYVSMLSEKCKSGTTNFLKGLMNGFVSNIKASSEDVYSSQIYVLGKNKAI
jgi:2-polyprenyl-3-methyl-5-hydroxy-6-metoxy-1,4-benzoquinol methylase